jgi:hypothetical protein
MFTVIIVRNVRLESEGEFHCAVIHHERHLPFIPQAGLGLQFGMEDHAYVVCGRVTWDATAEICYVFPHYDEPSKPFIDISGGYLDLRDYLEKYFPKCTIVKSYMLPKAEVPSSTSIMA